MFPFTVFVPLNVLTSFSYYPDVNAIVLFFPQTPKRASITKAFISYIQCFIAYCFKVIGMKLKGTCIYIMPLNDIIKHINEESNKQRNEF